MGPAASTGLRPELGRGFLPEEENLGSQVILISHDVWASQFGANKDIVGADCSFKRRSVHGRWSDAPIIPISSNTLETAFGLPLPWMTTRQIATPRQEPRRPLP